MNSNLANLPIHLLADPYPPGTDISRSMLSLNLADLPLTSAGRSYPYNAGHLVVKMSSNLVRSTPLVVTSHSQDEFKFGRSTPRSAGRSYPPVMDILWSRWVSNLVRCNPRSAGRSNPLVLTSHRSRMSSNLADLSLNLLADLHPQYWHLVAKMSSYLADVILDQLTDLTLPGTDISWSRMISNLANLPPRYWHLLVKMSSNLADLPLDLLADQSPQYWQLMAKMSSYLADLPLDQLTDPTPASTDILWSRWVQIWQIYPPGTDISHGQDEFKFGRSTPRSAGRATSPQHWTTYDQDELKFGRSTSTSGWQFQPPSTDIWWSRWVWIWQIYS